LIERSGRVPSSSRDASLPGGELLFVWNARASVRLKKKRHVARGKTLASLKNCAWPDTEKKRSQKKHHHVKKREKRGESRTRMERGAVEARKLWWAILSGKENRKPSGNLEHAEEKTPT